MTIEQRLFVVGREVTVVRHALVIVVGDQVEDVLFEVRAGAGDCLHLVAADHLGQRESQFGGAHRAGEGDHHLAAGVEVANVAVGRIDEGRRVEVAIVMAEESGKWGLRSSCRQTYRHVLPLATRYVAGHAAPRPCFPVFASTTPGIEALVAGELVALGIEAGASEPGGVEFNATSRQLADALLWLRTANRITVRVATFGARTFGELERHAAKVAWGDVIAPGSAVHFRVTSKKSKLYHDGGIAERLERSVLAAIPDAVAGAGSS